MSLDTDVDNTTDSDSDSDRPQRTLTPSADLPEEYVMRYAYSTPIPHVLGVIIFGLGPPLLHAGAVYVAHVAHGFWGSVPSFCVPFLSWFYAAYLDATVHGAASPYLWALAAWVLSVHGFSYFLCLKEKTRLVHPESSD